MTKSSPTRLQKKRSMDDLIRRNDALIKHIRDNPALAALRAIAEYDDTARTLLQGIEAEIERC